MTRAGRIAVLSLLYFVQGLPYGFQITALPTYLRTRGVSLTQIGLLGILASPWMLKALWAPLVDRYGSVRFGRRKSWIVPMQACLMTTCAVAAMVPLPAGLPVLLGLVFAMNLFAATMDIAVDGLAVDLLQDDELGPGNAAQVVGYKAGMLTGGGLLVWASASLGWSGLLAGMAILVAIVLGVTLLVREPRPEESARKDRSAGADASPPRSMREVVRDVMQALASKGMLAIVLFVGTYKLGESILDAMLKPMLVDRGFSPGSIGLWLGTYGMVASLLGSLAGGWLAARVPMWRAVTLATALRLLPLVGEWWLAMLPSPGAREVIGITIAEHLFGGLLTTVVFALMMSRVDPRVGATHYTFLATLEVLGKSPGGWLSGPLVERTSYATAFAVGVLLSLGLMVLLLPLRTALGPSRAGDGPTGRAPAPG